MILGIPEERFWRMTPRHFAFVAHALERRRRRNLDDMLLAASVVVQIAVGWPENGPSFPITSDDLFGEDG